MGLLEYDGGSGEQDNSVNVKTRSNDNNKGRKGMRSGRSMKYVHKYTVLTLMQHLRNTSIDLHRTII